MIEEYDPDLTDIETSALLANIPYLINSGRSINEIQAQLNEYDIDYTIDSDLTDEFSAVAFNDKNVIQAIRGTASLNDLVSDVGIASKHPLGLLMNPLLGVPTYLFGRTVGNTSLEARIKREYEKNDKINEKYADKQQTLIGHSLGGIAETIGRQRNIRTIGFNPAPQYENSPPHPESVIYRTFFDPVSAFSTSRDRERFITVPAKSFDTHGLINFLPDNYEPPNNLISNNILKENDNNNYKMDIQRTYGTIPTDISKMSTIGPVNSQEETTPTKVEGSAEIVQRWRDEGFTDAEISDKFFGDWRTPTSVNHHHTAPYTHQSHIHALEYEDIVQEMTQSNQQRMSSLPNRANTRANADREIGRGIKPQTRIDANRNKDDTSDKATPAFSRRPTNEVIEEVVSNLYAGTGRHNNIPSTIKTGMPVFSQKLDARRHTNLGMSPNTAEPILETLSHNDFCKIFPKRCEAHHN